MYGCLSIGIAHTYNSEHFTAIGCSDQSDQVAIGLQSTIKQPLHLYDSVSDKSLFSGFGFGIGF